MKKTLIGLATLAALATMGEDWPGTGIFTWNSISDFGDGSTPFTLGQGILEYTGPSGEVTVPLAFNPSGNRPATVRITNPDTTLTVSGRMTQSTGAFIKDGPGTLRLTNVGPNNLGVTREAEDKDNRDIVWDANGAVTNNGYARFTLNEGRLILDGGPTASNHFESICWVGSRTQKDTRLDIRGGDFTDSANWFCISRGAGLTNNTVRSSVYVSDNARVNLPGGICMNFANGTAGYYGRSLLHVDHSTVKMAGSFYVGEGAGEPTVVLTNNATLTCNKNDGTGATVGVLIGRDGYTPQANVKVVDGSTLETYALHVKSGSSLTVKDATLKFDRTIQAASRSDTLDAGAVTFDNATLVPRTSNTMHDWFNSVLDSPINVLGTLNVTAPAFSGIGRTLKSGGSGAAVAKNGAGYLTLRATDLPVTANAGTLRMSVPTTSKTNGLTGTISLASGAALEVAGEDALASMNVAASEAKFEPLGMEAQVGGWTTVDWARQRPDGVIQLMDNIGSKSGTASLNTKIPVDRSFHLSFDTFEYTISGRPADQLNIHFHEKSPSSLTGGNAGAAGSNSFTICVDYYWYWVKFLTHGAVRQSYATNSNGVYQTIYSLNFAQKRRYTVDYDAAAKKVGFTMTFPNGASHHWDYDVDLEQVCGQKTAYLGFGSNTGGSYNTHSITNLRFEEPGTPEVGFVGGRKTLAANETFTAKIAPTETQDAFLMGRLDYADGAAVCVTNVAFPDAQPVKTVAPSIEDQSQWVLTGGAYWRPDGTLATSRNNGGTYVSGSATTTQSVPIDGDWTASFDFQLGAYNTPADQVAFSLISGSSSLLDVNWRYYYDYTENGVKKNTRLTRVWVGNANGVTLGTINSGQICTNAAPIDLAKKGPAHMVLSYRRSAAELDVTMTQRYNGATLTKELTFTNIVLKVNDRAKIRFNGTVGGFYTENVISNLKFENAGLDAQLAKSDRIGSFGFERLNGSGTLVKRGPGDLALVATNNAHAALRIEEGGLCLRKYVQEPVTARYGGWQFNHTSGRTCAPNGIQIGAMVSSHASNAQTKRKVRVDGDWRCSFSLWLNSGSPADGLSFFMHNDSRGNSIVGGNNLNAGYSGIQNSLAVLWYFYPGNSTNYKKMGVGKNGAVSLSQSHAPMTLVGNTTDVVLTYDSTAKTLTSVMTQGATSMTNTFTDVDVAGNVKSDWAYLGFGVGCGGSQATPRFTNFRFERLTKADVEQTASYLASADVRSDATVRMDTSLTNAVFTLAPTVTLAAAKTLTAKSLNEASTLAMGTLTLGAGSALAGDGSTVIAPAALAGDLDALALDNATLALSAATAEARTLNKSEIHLAHGAKLAVKGNHVLSVGKVYVDGERVKGSVYRAGEADWVAEGSIALGGGTMMFIR